MAKLRLYTIWLMGLAEEPDWKLFDPVRDLLIKNDKFVIWRKHEQRPPDGATAVAIVRRRDDGWAMHAVSSHWAHTIQPMLDRWLDSQLLEGKNSLGPWKPSAYRGLLVLPQNSLHSVSDQLIAYNSLVAELDADDEADYRVPAATSSGPDAIFANDYQVAEWNFNFAAPDPLGYWERLRPRLLEPVQLIQHAKFDRHATKPITLGNAS